MFYGGPHDEKGGNYLEYTVAVVDVDGGGEQNVERLRGSDCFTFSHDVSDRRLAEFNYPRVYRKSTFCARRGGQNGKPQRSDGYRPWSTPSPTGLSSINVSVARETDRFQGLTKSDF